MGQSQSANAREVAKGGLGGLGGFSEPDSVNKAVSTKLFLYVFSFCQAFPLKFNLFRVQLKNNESVWDSLACCDSRASGINNGCNSRG